MTNEVAVAEPQARAPMVGMDTVKVTDLQRPNLKLLQALSPEVDELGVPAGQFLVDVLNMELGQQFEFTVLAKKVRYVLWNPQRGVDPMILAQSTDGITWDKSQNGEDMANKEFEVMIKNVGKVKWNTRGSVAESGLAEFGSSVPSDPDSKPAAAETHDFLIKIHGHDVMPVVMSLSRSKIKPARRLNTIIFSAMEPRLIKIKAKAVERGEGGEKFYNLVFSQSGRVENGDDMFDLSEKFANFVVRDVDDEAEGGEGRGRKSRAPVNESEREY